MQRLPDLYFSIPHPIHRLFQNPNPVEIQNSI